jgi:2'-5' RNA ligase
MARDRAAPPEARPLRLFLAFELPEEAKRLVAEAVAPWQEAAPKARWVPPESWHVTLKFLGPTHPRLLAWVEEAAAGVAASTPPARARLVGLGAFPSHARARVCWAGVDEPTGALARLSSVLDVALAKEFRADARGFRPHLTVARSEPPIALPEAYAATPLVTEMFAVERVVLYRSRLLRPAATYEALRTFPLEG